MLNKERVLERTNNGLDVFRHYISGEWRVGRNFLNPLYEDKRASYNVYFDRRSNSYKMKDFGNDVYSGNCFDIVGKIKGLDCSNGVDFIEILKTIDHDLSLICSLYASFSTAWKQLIINFCELTASFSTFLLL